MKTLVITLLLLCSTIRADDASAHKAAHFGVSFALNQTFYAINRNGLGMDKKNALLFSIFTTAVIGFTYKYLEMMSAKGDSFTPDFGRSMLWNGFGVVSSVVVIEIGDW